MSLGDPADLPVKKGSPDAAITGRGSSPTSLRARAVLIGLALIPINARWVNEIENIRNYMWPSMFSLPLNVITLLFVLILLNLLTKRLAPRWTLSAAELLIVYSMLAVSSVIGGWAFVSQLVGWIAAPVYRATPENDWANLFVPFLPDWLVLKDRAALESFFLGQSTFWRRSVLAAWAAPLAAWTVFLLAFIGAMACVSVILRRRWMDEERLSFPVVKLPFELARADKAMLRNRLFWVGFGFSSALALSSGLTYLYPGLPGIPTPLFEIGSSLKNSPWNALESFGGMNMPVRIYPWVVGFGMLMPLEVLFSYWFFYWFLALQHVLVAATGWQVTPEMPYVRRQVGGAMLAIAPAVLWGSRHYLKAVWVRAVHGRGPLDDRNEAISYRTALLGLVGCALVMTGIAMAAGMNLWVVVTILGIYFLMTLSVTRARAEIGGPANEIGFMNHDSLLVGALGPGVFNRRNLAVLSLFSWSGFAYGEDPVPHQIEGLKLAQQARFNPRWMFGALALAVLVGIVSAFTTLIAPLYKIGAEGAGSNWDGVECATGWSYSKLQEWLGPLGTKPGERSYATGALGCGFVFALLQYALRSRYLGWPFHPLGFVMAGNYYAHLMWPSMFVVWLIKLLILRYGGLKKFTDLLPFFLGLIVGDAVIGSLWSVVAMIFKTRVFSVWI